MIGQKGVKPKRKRAKRRHTGGRKKVLSPDAVMVSALLEPPDVALLRDEAKRRGLTRSQVIREAVQRLRLEPQQFLAWPRNEKAAGRGAGNG